MIDKQIFYITVGVLIGIILILIIYIFIRERILLGRLQDMLDAAIAGTFEDKTLDETKRSQLENSMWRFLCDHESSSAKLASQKEKIQTLITDISHQTTTPIANIMLYSQLLEEQQIEENGEEVSEEIASIREQAEKLDFLIQSLVKLSRLENGIISVHNKQVPIQAVLENAKHQLEAKASDKNITLQIDPTDEQAFFDQKWTTEAVVNIMDNAVKYTPAGGKIHVSVIPYNIFVRIDITDNGIGIAEKDITKIFMRFYRSLSLSDEPGVGIGLYLAREVIEAQKGYIKVKSELGKGSTFSVFLLKN